MWRVILSHLFGAIHQERNSQFYYHKMAHAYREPLLEPSSLSAFALPPTFPSTLAHVMRDT